MSNTVAGCFCTLRGICLSILLISASTPAGASWQSDSSRYLSQLLKTNSDQLQELGKPAVLEFYRDRDYKLLWSTEQGRLDRAYDLLQAIIHAKDEGLIPADYYLEDLNKFWDSTGLGESVRLDLFLSASLYRYSNDVYSGRFKASDLDADWHIKNQPVDVRRVFTDVDRKTSIAQYLKQLPPRHSAYELLKQQLQHFRELAQQGGWRRLAWGPVLEREVQHEQVVQLRRRLQLTGDLVMDPFPDMDVFDRWLEEAVRRYQARHGLEVDGKVGPRTRRSLNITVGERIRQIRINMERWRWLPRELGKRYLVVNMAGFELYIIEDGLVELSMPVIIGKSYRATPTFSGLVSYMEYNPYWIIPTNMVLEDIVPRQIADPDYLSNRSIKVYRGWTKPREIDPQTVDWSKLDKEHFPYWLRQEPGPKNALGRIKFLFSNPYEIYLHGTPDKHLFDRVVRTFSSGCIRVQDPVRLAAFLLNEGTQQREEEVLANIYLGTNQGVTLPIAVPIYLVYLTAWVDQDGTMNFRDDIYGRDTRLNQAFDL
jgi:murein L,D-transpeptidase YcbB/YkuD